MWLSLGRGREAGLETAEMRSFRAFTRSGLDVLSGPDPEQLAVESIALRAANSAAFCTFGSRDEEDAERYARISRMVIGVCTLM
jgi:hypothetical protein